MQEAEEDEKAFTEVARAEAEQAAEHRKAEEARLARAKKVCTLPLLCISQKLR